MLESWHSEKGSRDKQQSGPKGSRRICFLYTEVRKMSQSTLSRWPASEFVSLREAMDRLLSESVVNSPFRTLWSTGTNGNSTRVAIPLDVYATSDEVVVVASAPGLSPDDLQITVDQGTLTIGGQIH